MNPNKLSIKQLKRIIKEIHIENKKLLKEIKVNDEIIDLLYKK